MDYNQEKVDEMTLALLHLTTSKEEYGNISWKNYSWEVLNRLHEKGYIANPKTKSKSVMVTEEGVKVSEELFKKHFSS